MVTTGMERVATGPEMVIVAVTAKWMNKGGFLIAGTAREWGICQGSAPPQGI